MVKRIKMSSKNNKTFNNYIVQLLIVTILIIVVNIIGSYVFTRFDLTSEKRYTLSKATRNLLDNVDDIVYFRVFLDGDFPAGFKRLKRETKELLDEFRAYNKNIEYEFINPSASDNVRERNDTYQLLMEQGLQPTNLQVKTKSGVDQQVIFPGALVTYKNNELPIELLDAQLNVLPEATLNNSIQNLEFKFAEVISSLSKSIKPKVAFIEGHGELSDQETYDITLALSHHYIVDRVTIDGKINSLVKRLLVDSTTQRYEIIPSYAAIIIAKPDSLFSRKDKFIIDQYIMYGGKILWLIDPVFASMDSIQLQENTVSIESNLDLQAQLFSYGARLNNDLILDLNAMQIPIRTGQIGGQAQIDFFSWYYFPVITATSKHPVVKNLNAIKTQFVSSLDTTSVKGVKKTILLRTSDYSKVEPVPGIISLQMLREEPDIVMYSGPPKPIAVLLEGKFKSDFRNRLPQSIVTSKEIGYKDRSVQTRMIVVSDGDIIRNQFHIPNGYPLPLGYDQFTGQTFGNKEFILNAMNYLTDGPGLISLRSRETKLRMLDKTKISENRIQWQLFNLLAPILLVVFTGIVLVWLRKRKYTR
jgi:gliding motility-associatede transport system auxiliary component